MGDTLRYRIPESPVVSKSGSFQLIKRLEDANGFVVSKFAGDELFTFIEDESKSEIHLNSSELFAINQKEYFNSAQSMLDGIVEKGMQKAVLSRIKKVKKQVDVNDFFEALCSSYPSAFVHLISSPLFGTWIGASPEVLLKSQNEKCTTMALAGTVSVDMGKNWSDKNIKEQQYVSDFILNELLRIKVGNIEIKKSADLQAGPVKHINSLITFDRAGISTSDIVRAIHPTPAVCGLPREEAMNLINIVEKHKRELYAGFIGLMKVNNTELFINLRCAQITKEWIYLYLGGGFTKDSQPEDEWQETEKKSETLLNIIEKLALK